MDLRQLEAFVAVATLGSFKSAANRLSLTQPAVSARIASLETEIGEALFLRGMRPIGLSDKAKRMLPYAEQMLDLSHHIRPSVLASSGATVERLRIGTNSSLVHGWLPQLSSRLRGAMPQVIIEYEVDASHRLRDRMRSGSLDICLMHAPADIPGIRRQHICDMHAIWAARPDVVSSRYLCVEDLVKHNLITFGPEAPSFLMFEAVLRRKGLWPVVHLSTNYADIIVNQIKHTDFVGMLLNDCIIHELNSGSLVEVATDFEMEKYSLFVCYSVTKSKNLVSRCINVIRDFTTNELPTIRSKSRPRDGRNRKDLPASTSNTIADTQNPSPTPR